MCTPQVDIQVSDETGRWTVDALPMILIPQHFFLNHHFALERELGREKLKSLFHAAGYDSAYQWCEKEALHHGLKGVDVFFHYMKRISQRGWGQFKVVELDLENSKGSVEVRNSAFMDGARRGNGRSSCYRFESWFEGSLDYIARASSLDRRFEAREVRCASDGVSDACLFGIAPRA